ncbi:MAG: hypothetical protein ACFE0Q_01215 [Anaerolineae bacterium]
MTDTPQNPSHDDDDRQWGVNATIDHLAVTGHVVFAGRDGTVQVTTGGDVAQTSDNKVIVGGIQASPEAYKQLVATFDQAEQEVDSGSDDEDTRELAQHYMQTIKRLLTSKKKPNLRLLIDSTKKLTKLGPFFAALVAQIFAEPLVSQIIENLGQGGIGFLKALRAYLNA